ncbi:MAG: hypothetical protein Q8Q52_06790 [Acidimicrobiia bacterium]|nr:hypothetical protein [Acidimicrobiia bacterium]
MAPPRDEVELGVTEIPDGWVAQIRGGAFVVDRVMFNEALNHDLKLEVDIPLNAAEGEYQASDTSGHPIRTRSGSLKQRR